MSEMDKKRSPENSWTTLCHGVETPHLVCGQGKGDYCGAQRIKRNIFLLEEVAAEDSRQT